MGIVRYFLSIFVVIAHTSVLTGVDLPLNSYSAAAVGGFFSLSGFLLFSSFQRRPTWRHYVERRVRRIMPPYFVIVILCAVAFVGISSLSWSQYYSNSGFWKYLAANLSFLNFLHPDLPGVFQGPQFFNSAVNGSLWTMKGEWICYLGIPVVFGFITKSKRFCIACLLSAIAICLGIQYLLEMLYHSSGNKYYMIFGNQFASIFSFFLCGALVNVCYEKFLRYNKVIIISAIVILLIGEYNPLYYNLFRPFAISCAVLWFSQIGKWGTFLKNHDDLSYDMYLFHYPIIQLSVFLGLPDSMNGFALLGLILATTFIFAVISWNLVGKRILKRK